MRQKVNDIVTALMNDVTSFTSLDVSNLVKREGFSNVRHRNVAEEVRNLYDSGDMDQCSYERTIIDVTLANGSVKQAFLYHHCMTDPDTYNRRSQVAIPPANVPAVATTGAPGYTTTPTPAAPTPAPATPAAAATPAPVQARNQKGDCRLEVPASWVRELGWADGDVVYLCDSSNTSIEVKTSDDVGTNDSVVGTVQISGGRLRISKGAFDRAGFSHGPGNQLNVTLFNDRVLVEN